MSIEFTHLHVSKFIELSLIQRNPASPGVLYIDRVTMCKTVSDHSKKFEDCIENKRQEY